MSVYQPNSTNIQLVGFNDDKYATFAEAKAADAVFLIETDTVGYSKMYCVQNAFWAAAKIAGVNLQMGACLGNEFYSVSQMDSVAADHHTDWDDVASGFYGARKFFGNTYTALSLASILYNYLGNGRQPHTATEESLNKYLVQLAFLSITSDTLKISDADKLIIRQAIYDFERDGKLNLQTELSA